MTQSTHSEKTSLFDWSLLSTCLSLCCSVFIVSFFFPNCLPPFLPSFFPSFLPSFLLSWKCCKRKCCYGKIIVTNSFWFTQLGGCARSRAAKAQRCLERCRSKLLQARNGAVPNFSKLGTVPFPICPSLERCRSKLLQAWRS